MTKSLSSKQKKIANQSPPYNKITGEDFQTLKMKKGNDISKNMFAKNNGNSKKST